MATKKLQIIGSLGQGGNNVVPDWNQNNSAAADYIKNRPFYTGSVEKEIYDVNAELTAASGALTSMQVSATEYLHSVNTSNSDVEITPINLVEGKQYVIIADGNRYEYTAQSVALGADYNYAHCVYIGELDALLTQDIANFTIGVATNTFPNGYVMTGVACKSTSANPPSSFKVYGFEEEVKQLDPKYYERLAWVDNGASHNTWKFDGNLDSVEYIDQGGMYAIKICDFIEPTELIGTIATGTELTEDGEEMPFTIEVTQDMIEDMSSDIGFPAFNIGDVVAGFSQDYMMFPAGVYVMYIPGEFVISEITALKNIFKEPDVIHTIDHKFFEKGAVGWTEKGNNAVTNIFEFDGNLDNIDHLPYNDGYFVKMLDKYVTPEAFIGGSFDFINTYGEVVTTDLVEDDYQDMSGMTGVASYIIADTIASIAEDVGDVFYTGTYFYYHPEHWNVTKVTAVQNIFNASTPDIIHKVHQKYVPNADWSVNDPEAEGYIKNRPIIKNIIESNTLEFDGNLDNAEAYQVGDGMYLIKMFDEYIEPENLVDSTLSIFTSETNTIEELQALEDNIRYSEEDFGVPAYNINDIVYAFSADVPMLGISKGFYFMWTQDGFATKLVTKEPVFSNTTYKIDPDWLPAGMGGSISWNDLTDKPFGVVSIKEKGDEIFAISYDFVASDGGDALYTEDSEIVITEGETYFVDYDGTTYECVAYLANGGSEDEPRYLPVIGNTELVGVSGGNGEPFFIGANRGVTYVYVSTEGAHDVALYSCVESGGIKKLDKKYLPDDIGGATSWNNLTDKPFGEEYDKVIFSTSYNFSTSKDGSHFTYITGGATFEIIEGQTYVVDYDGTSYECIAYYSVPPSDFPTIGNSTLSSSDVNAIVPNGGNNEPFVITIADEDLLMYVETEGLHHISIHEVGHTKLDKKYLSIKWEDLLNKPFIPLTVYYEWQESEYYSDYVSIPSDLNAPAKRFVRIGEAVDDINFFAGKYIRVVPTVPFAGETGSKITQDMIIMAADGVYSIANLVFVILVDSYDVGNGIILTKGVWTYDNWNEGYNDYNALRIVTPAKYIDESVIPPTIARASLVEQAVEYLTGHFAYGTEDLIAGESQLATGKFYFVYE